MNKLYNTFHSHFQIVPANNMELLETAYRLRYQVYCKEHRYEDTNLFPDNMETDEYDAHSCHSLIRCKPTGCHTGLVRLILPDPEKPDRKMPVEKHCHLIDQKTDLNLAKIPRESLAEISRFCISREAKQTCLETPRLTLVRHSRRTPGTTSPNKTLQYTTLGLFSAIIRMSEENNISHCLAIMQPALLRLLSGFGIRFHKIGSLIDYHGKRQPVIGILDEMVGGIYERRRDVWETITSYGKYYSPGEEIQHTATGY